MYDLHEASGTTELFTRALASFSADWIAGSASSVEWPVAATGNGVAAKRNQGVADAVINTANSLGYVELSYTVSNTMTYADMINKAGKKVTPNAQSLASAINDFGTAAFSEEQAARWKVFGEYLKQVSKGKEPAIRPDYFESYLAYAAVFGLGAHWAKYFQNLDGMPLPIWFHATAGGDADFGAIVAVMSTSDSAGAGGDGGAGAGGASGGGSNGAG